MGALAALGAAFVWAIATLLFERHGAKISGLTLNFVKCVVAVALMAPTQLALHGSPTLSTIPSGGYALLAASGFIGLAVGDTLWFACMLRVGAQRALLIYQVAPPLAAIAGHLFLGERMSPWGGLGMAVTLGGIAWVVAERSPASGRPEIDVAGVLWGVGSALCQSVGTILTKLAAPEGDALEVSIVRLVAGSAGLFLLMAGSGRLRSVGAVFAARRTAVGLVGAAVLGTYLGVWLMNAGFLLTSVGVAATLNATSPIFVLILAYLFLDQRPSLRSATGVVVAVAGVGMLFATSG